MRLRSRPPACRPPSATQPPPPACPHLNAIKVESIIDPDEVVAYWCEDCQAQLGEDFGCLMRSCCGTPPGDLHLYNCPHRATLAP